MSNTTNPYLELANSMPDFCKPSKAEMELYLTWNTSTGRLEPTVEQFVKACEQDSISTLHAMTLEYIEILIHEKGLSEDYWTYWHDAEEEVAQLVSDAHDEFGATH